MYSLILLSAVSFIVALVATPLVRNFFRGLQFVDAPDGERKLHDRAVPRVGGIALAIAYILAFAVLLLVPFSARGIVLNELPLFWKLLPSAGLVFATGLLDDMFGLKPWQKLAGQCVAASLVIFSGISITGLAGFHFPAWLASVVTFLWLVGCANAFNLIDGVDGLAAGVGLFATVTTLLAALLHQNMALALATAPLAGALLGFLRYNFNPASIFLGDCGSLLTGFLLGCFSVVWSQKSATVLGMTAPLMALCIPLVDTGLAIVRRFLRLQPIFGADRGHIHHKLLQRGLTPRRVALLMYGVCGLAAGFSLLQTMPQNQYHGFIIVIFCGAAWIGVQHLGYVEFGLAGRLVLQGTFRKVLNAQLAIQTLDSALRNAVTVEECWAALRAASASLGVHGVRARLLDQDFQEPDEAVSGAPVPMPRAGALDPIEAASSGAKPAALPRGEVDTGIGGKRDGWGRAVKMPHASRPSWQVHVPLTERDWVVFDQRFHESPSVLMLAPLVDLLRTQLVMKLDELRGEPEEDDPLAPQKEAGESGESALAAAG